jgi:hypothetical protein
VFQNRAYRALTVTAAIWISATTAQAAEAGPGSSAAPFDRPSLTHAILRDKDLGPSVPQMTSRLWSELHRIHDGAAIRSAQVARAI